MNILFVYEVDYIKKVVFDMHMLAEAMSLRRHNVYAIDYQSMWKNNDKSPKEEIAKRVFPESKLHLIHPNFIRLPILCRLSAFVTHFFAIRKVIKEKQIEAIVLYSVPTNGLQAVFWAKIYGIPVIFRSLDVLNQIVTQPILSPFIKLLEKIVYRKVDMVATLTPKLSEYVCKLGAKKAEVLLMTVDTKSFDSFKSDMGKKWGIKPDDLVILFMGTLFNFSGLDKFISKFKEILWTAKKAKLLIVGDGEQRKDLEILATAYNIPDKVIITGFQPYNEMPSYINLADVCIMPFQENEVTKDIFPGKIVQYLACAKPVVATDLSGIKSVIKGKEQGVVYAKDTDEMIESVASLLDSPEDRWMIGSYGWNYARQEYSCEIIAEQLENILKENIGRAK